MMPRDPSAVRCAALLRFRFAGREDCYLSEMRHKVPEPVTDEILDAHLRGEERIGIYSAGERAAYLAFDFDGKRIGPERAWKELLAVERAILAAGLPEPVRELSRGGEGYHLLAFSDPADLPTVAEAQALGRALLRSAGLPDDSRESAGHVGIYPKPPGPEGIGGTVYLPWAGLLNGKQTSLFLDAEKIPLARQESALENVETIAASRAREVTAALSARWPAANGKPPAAPLSLDGPGTGNRHPALCSLSMRLAHKAVPREDARLLLAALAAQWGLPREGRADEVDDLVESAYQKTGKPEEPAPLRALDLAALLTAPPEPIPYAVAPWLVRRDTVLFAGEPKTGKSWLALSLAVALASGRPWLGLPVERGPYRVLYADEENNPRLIAYRLRKLAAAEQIPPADLAALPLHYLAGNGLNLSRDSKREQFLEYINGFRADYVILDSLVRFHAGDESSNSAMAAFAASVTAPLKNSGIGTILIHHLAKPSKERTDIVHRVRGAGDLVAACDSLWTLERPPDSPLLVLSHALSRWSETAPSLAVEIEDLEICGGVRLSASEIETTAEQTVRATLETAAYHGILRENLIAAIKTETDAKSAPRIASKILSRLHKAGTVKRRGEGKRARYWLATLAPEDAL